MRDAPRRPGVRSVWSQAGTESAEDRRCAPGPSHLYRRRHERYLRQFAIVAGTGNRAGQRNGGTGDSVYHPSGIATQYRRMVRVSQDPHRSRFLCVDVRFHDGRLVRTAGRARPRLGQRLFYHCLHHGGIFGVRASLQSLQQWTIDVDLLMVLAALGAAVIGAPFEGAMLLFLFSFSNVLQAYAIDRTRKAINSLMKLRPDKALTRRDGNTVLLPIDQLVVGDNVIVRPGESIALDSVIVEGESSINESSLTGESIPVLKKVGDPVFAATINQTGGLEVRVTRLAKDSTIEKLIRMVEEAQSEKAETQRFLDRAEQFYAIGVISFTVALIVWPLFFLNEPFGETFYRAMTVMVVASPCALIISTPASILSAIGGAARRGVLFKEESIL